MVDNNEILEAVSDIIKNVTPGNPNAMDKALKKIEQLRAEYRGNPNAMDKAIALALISIAQERHARRHGRNEENDTNAR